jgi:PST family polysaccharide transporter
LSNYRQIFKSTAFLGSNQLILTAIALIRNKMLAVLLGPAGVGLQKVPGLSIKTMLSRQLAPH